MRQVLESKGWVMYHECMSCGHKQWFNHPEKAGYEIRAKVKSNTFSILLENKIIAGPFWGFEIEEKLLKYAN